MNAMTESEQVFCIECGKFSSYKIRSEQIECTIKGVHFIYTEEEAYCVDCNEAVYVPEVNDRNVIARENAYRTAAGLISVKEINQLMTKYNIGAEPLGLVLGFGKVTITRYLNGQLPSKVNSDQLFTVLKSHAQMEIALESQKDKISSTAYQKCRFALDKLNSLYTNNKIEVVTRYLLAKSSEITPLALQKLLYYSQVFFTILFGRPLFSDKCFAWAHGPVYPQVYQKYKEYGYNPIDIPSLETDGHQDILDSDELELLNTITRSFGRYSGKTLEAMTHLEKPWIDTRQGLAPFEPGHSEIPQDEINAYFTELCEKLQIKNLDDIQKYCDYALRKAALL